MTAGWVVVARIPQVDGGTRLVYVRARDRQAVLAALAEDPARIDGLWVPTRVRDLAPRDRR